MLVVAKPPQKRRRGKTQRERAVLAKAKKPGKDSQLYNLTLDIHDLKQQLHDLATQRELLLSRALYSRVDAATSGSIVRTARRYFHGFAHGYRASDVTQSAFVHAISDPRLSMGTTGFGVEMLLEQWRRYTQIFQIHENVLLSTEIISAQGTEEEEEDGCVVVKCTLRVHGLFTQAAIHAVFPHVAHDLQLLMQVLGKPMVCVMTFHLFFTRYGKLMRHDASSDFTSAILEVVKGNANEVVRVMDGARIHEESMVDPVEEEAAHAIAKMTICSGDGSGSSKRRRTRQVEPYVVAGGGDEEEEEGEEEKEKDHYGGGESSQATMMVVDEEESEKKKPLRRRDRLGNDSNNNQAASEEDDDDREPPSRIPRPQGQAAPPGSGSMRHSLAFLLD